MPPIAPNSRTWTLRLKRHRTTILLHADPIQKLSSLRSELLLALQQSHPSGELDGRKIPQSADDIILAKPVDINDLSAGWERLEKKEAPFADESSTGTPDTKGKGKAKATVTAIPGAGAGAKGKASNAKLTDCPQGAGLRDGGIVAFRFRSEDEARLREGEVEGEFVMLEEDKRGEAEQWDVKVPTIEETYAEEDAAVSREG